jgi:small subunit ribosomal protein S2
MKRYILTDRSGIYIIDLQQSVTQIDAAYNFVRDLVANGGSVMFVGTKKQAQEVVSTEALRVGQPYINQRWLGGLLTNFNTVNKRIQRLKELDTMDFEDASKSSFTKKELLIFRRERDKLEKSLGGIRNMAKIPQAIWVVDTNKEHLAITEAKKLGIPVIAILDTNCDPEEVTIGIPGNDDAIRSIEILTKVIADAAADGMIARHSKDEEQAEPLAEWERELLEQGQTESESKPAAVSKETPAAVEAEAVVSEPKVATKAEPKSAAAKAEPKSAAAKAEPKAAAVKKPAAAKAEPKAAAVKKPAAAKAEPKAAAVKKPAAKKAEPKAAESAPKAKTEKKDA